jgi:exodeoxyribonuclease VII large subunit
MEYEIERRRYALATFANHPAMTKPMEMVHLRSRLVDEFDQRAKQAIEHRLQESKSTVATLAASLSALSPLNTLARGYSVTRDQKGNAISDAGRVELGQQVKTTLANGEFTSIVNEIN